MCDRYIVKTATQKFLMTILDRTSHLYVKFGGMRNDCIDIFLYKDEITNNYTFGKLAQIDYDNKCNLQGNMKKGVGTRDMICAALISIKCLYPNVSSLRLDDASTITCSNNKKVSLASYYLAFHGKTWYELNFNAIPVLKDKESYYKKKTLMNDINYKNSLEWFNDLLRSSNIEMDINIKKTLLNFYKSSNTYTEFFNKLKSYYSKSELCINTRDWIHAFISEELLNVSSQSWLIDMNLYSCTSFVKISKLSDVTK